jgi:hypothetical protein
MVMITDVTQAMAERASAQLDDLHTQLLRLHRPRTVAGGQVRCTECATYVNGALRRMDWPCRTARAMGIVIL